MFKPMLAGKCTDLETLNYPVLVSPKLDGVRATVQAGQLFSRSLKPIPNANVQAMFAGLPDGLDGELIFGTPTDEDVYRNTVSIVMSEDKSAQGIIFYVFDFFGSDGFAQRLKNLPTLDMVLSQKIFSNVHPLQHRIATNAKQVTTWEEKWLEEGYEGLMIRSLYGPYKEGRSTEKEGYLLKLKRFCDSEAVVLGYEEQMHNANEAKTNALGRTERSTAQDGLVGAGVLGALVVHDAAVSEVDFAIGTGFNAADRTSLWKQRKTLAGRKVKYTYFPTGSKERPRFPVYQGFRDPRDT